MTKTTQEPQTVYFKAKFLYDRIPRTRETEELIFDSLELMILTYRKARRCRAIADRPTGGLYKMQLTQFGEELCASDPYVAERHEMVGKNFWI